MITIQWIGVAAAAFLISLTVCFSLTPLVKLLAKRVGAVDIPKDYRRMHKKPIPRLGGIAIFLGFLAAVLLCLPMTDSLKGILFGSIIIVALGCFDDVFSLGAKFKFVVQIVAALVSVMYGNVITTLSNPNVFSADPYWNLGILSIPITILWIVAITNAMNFIDGIDGLAVGISAISGTALLAIAILMGGIDVSILMAALVGACIGFLPYNMNPAKIFMGDTGATLLGFLLATVSIQGLFKFYTIISFTVPILLLGIPIFDICFACVRRALKGQNPMKADRSHLHHRLIDMGFNQKQVVSVLYVASISLGLSAVVLTAGGSMKITLFLLVIFVAVSVISRMLFHYDRAGDEARPEESGGTEEKEGIFVPESGKYEKVRVLSVFGTRPEAIKMAPLLRELQSYPEIESLCCVTGQHRDMLDAALAAFQIEPDFDLDIMEPGQTLTSILSGGIVKLEQVLLREKPDLVLVHGDTAATLSGALSAYYQKIPVGHVEAGLRTYNRYFPFPEEMNRRLAAPLAQLHFCPTPRNAGNLRGEGVSKGILVTGNTVVDALTMTIRKDYRFAEEFLNHLDYTSRKVILVTCHRRENIGEPMARVMQAVKEVTRSFPDVLFLFPVHPNPLVRTEVYQSLGALEHVKLLEPLSVLDMHNLLARCFLVLTDSGGLQEEAPAFGKPVLVLRAETERPEAVEAGSVKLVGTETEVIVSAVSKLLREPTAYRKMAHAVNPYGDGHASMRIAQSILWHFGLRQERPMAFSPSREKLSLLD